ncbi:MAG: hypothetical protein AAF915_23820 [Cyanobacteria bacterium P01_D01_bin.50]
MQKCPTSLPLSLQSLWYEKKGKWDEAHTLLEDASDKDSAYRREDDLNNARYWYNRSGKSESKVSLDEE